MKFNEQFDEWQNRGTEPSEDLKKNGFQGGQKPPNIVFNWFWSKVIRAITEIQTILGALSKSDVGLGNVDNTADINKPISTATQAALKNKVDKVTGKDLSTNDYTTAEKDKLASIEAGAKNYTLPTAGTDFGGVKSGGDVNISGGIITVKDDSHNHTIDNVDGLQSALDGKSPIGHSHSKSEVGLSNVPNVATNDQTPTYSDTTTLATLTSGEKISVAFSKIKKAITDLISHIGNKNNPHEVNKTQIGLSNVDNTSDTNKPVSTAQATAIADAKKSGTDAQNNLGTHIADKSNPHGVTKGQVGLGNVPNVATNDQTPTYTEASSLTKLTSGEKISIALGKIAKAISDLISHIGNTTAHITSSERNTWNSKANASHTHSKSEVGLSNVPNVVTNDQTPTYTEASSLTKLTSGEKISIALGKIAKAINDLISHISNTSNPHSVNKSQVGLGSVDNTSDADKPISTAQATAIAEAKKAGTDAQTNLDTHIANKSNPHGVNKTQVGLGNVPNVATNDQTPTYTAASTLATLTSGEKMSVAFGKIKKAITDLISHIGNKSNPHGVTKSQVGLGNVDNTSDTNKPVSTAQATAIADAKKSGTDAQSNLNSHIANKSNPHGVTPSQIGAVACTTDMTFSVDSNGILTITY